MSTPLVHEAKAPFKRLFQYIQPFRKEFYTAVFQSFINKGLDLAPPVLVGWAIDTVTRRPPNFISFLAGEDPWKSGAVLGFLGFAIFGIESFFQWRYTLNFASLAQNVQHNLRVDTYASMQNREMAFFENHRLGDTMAILGDDVNQLERFLNTVFNDIVQIASLFVIAGIILFTASPDLSLIAIAPMPFVIWFALKFQKFLTPRYRKVRQAVGQVSSRLENNISGIAVIKAFLAEKFEKQRLIEASRGYLSANMDALRYSAAFTPLIRMGVAVGFGLTLFIGAVWTISGKVSPGTYTLFTMMCQRILWPLTRLGTILDETERCRASAVRIFSLLDTPSQITDRPAASVLRGFTSELKFEHVRFQYDKGPEILKDLDFTIRRGETVGVAGATGSGKSTLVKLLLRFYDPTAGTVSIDGQDLRTLNLASLREQIALVSQDVYIFHGTIGENIRYAVPTATTRNVEDAARQASLHDFILSLPSGYDTLVGERGIKLSGGQRQRLSIARALLKDAPILILDEATSSVDTETEREIQKNLTQFTKGRTAIIIAHRLSTIRGADRILVIDRGRLVEEGTHDRLIAKPGTYKDLWAVQSGELGLRPSL